MIRLTEESTSSSRAEDEVSTITIEPTNLVDTAATTAAPFVSRAARPALRGIVIKEPAPQEEPTQKEILEGKRKKKVKIIPTTPSRESAPSNLRRARREAEENKLREEAWI